MLLILLKGARGQFKFLFSNPESIELASTAGQFSVEARGGGRGGFSVDPGRSVGRLAGWPPVLLSLPAAASHSREMEAGCRPLLSFLLSTLEVPGETFAAETNTILNRQLPSRPADRGGILRK